MDTEERFNLHLRTRRKDLESLGWLTKKITYKFNSLGFRSEEFTDQPSVMFLGCSNTLGIGLPVEETWAHIVSQSLKLRCANLAIGAGSADTAFRMCVGYIDRIKPKVVIYNIPPLGRIELVKPYHTENILFNSIESTPYQGAYFNEYIAEDTNIELNYKKNQLAIQILCEQRDIKYHCFDNYGGVGCHKPTARDLMHGGSEYNEVFAQHVLAELCKQ